MLEYWVKEKPSGDKLLLKINGYHPSEPLAECINGTWRRPTGGYYDVSPSPGIPRRITKVEATLIFLEMGE